jgi:group I intron endonuclease
MTKQSGVYGIRNLKTGEWYIGASVDLKHRKQDQLRTLKDGHNQNRFLQAAYNKHGVINFIFIVLEYAPINKLDERERYFIAHYKTNQAGHGYNIARGGAVGNMTERAIRIERREASCLFESRQSGAIGRSIMRKRFSHSQN